MVCAGGESCGLLGFAGEVAGGFSRIASVSLNSRNNRSRPVSVSANFGMPVSVFHMSAEDLELSMWMTIGAQQGTHCASILFDP